MNQVIRVGAAQMEIIYNDYEGNLKRCEAMLKEAALEKVEILCFPEYFSTGVPPKAEPIPGPTIDFLKQKAKEYGIEIIGGTIVEERDNKLYNTCCYISKKGEILGKYSKIHLWLVVCRINI
ncbi:MAG: carbon-nitrogen hydrolase family protein [Candidatus Edwardsbacteria bacterium]